MFFFFSFFFLKLVTTTNISKFLIFMLVENFGSMAESQYTGFHKITNGNVLNLQCIYSYVTSMGTGKINFVTNRKLPLSGHVYNGFVTTLVLP